MGSQSDIPSQGGAPARSNVNPFAGLGVASAPNAIPGSVPDSGVLLTTFEARPSNAVDYIFPVRSLLAFVDGAKQGIVGRVEVPNGYVFVMRAISISAAVHFTAIPPYAIPPSPADNYFLTDVNGNVSNWPNVGYTMALAIGVNEQSTIYRDIDFVNLWATDYTLPLYYAVDESTPIDISLSGEPASSIYNPVVTINSQLSLYGNLLPATGVMPSDEPLTRTPIPVKETP